MSKVVTLANLAESTEQEVFDQVVRHLNSQKEKSESSSKCLYRYIKNDGTVFKCAAGALIADDEYKDEMDDVNNLFTGWSNLVEKNLVPENHVELITRLQIIHDTKDVCYWKIDLQKLADKYKLSFAWVD